MRFQIGDIVRVRANHDNDDFYIDQRFHGQETKIIRRLTSQLSDWEIELPDEATNFVRNQDIELVNPRSSELLEFCKTLWNVEHNLSPRDCILDRLERSYLIDIALGNLYYGIYHDMTNVKSKIQMIKWLMSESENNDSIVHGLKIVMDSPSLIEAKKNFIDSVYSLFVDGYDDQDLIDYITDNYLTN